jgi:hypothetical protein
MEASDTLVKILEGVMRSHTQIVEALTRLEERQQEHNLALARAMAESTQSLAQMIERMETRMADRDHALAQILERVVDTTSRTEQMTARILTEVSKGASH